MSILNDQTIKSTDDGSAASFPTKMDAPPPPTSEILRHTGAINTIDPQIYVQNIKKTSVNWSVVDERGKVLATFKCHPSNMGAIVQHQMPQYHFWKGDMKVLVRVMGTAYQAGQGVLVEMPPGVDVYEVAASGDYTGYNWVAFDVKDTELIEITIRDVNQGMFHYVDDLNSYDPLNSGSSFAMIVDSPLNSTTGGTQQVGIEIWTKPAENFRFSKLRIPRLIKSTANIAPVEITHALNFSQHNYPDHLSNVQYICDKIEVLPNSIKTIQFTLFGSCKLDSEWIIPQTTATGYTNPTLTATKFGDYDTATSSYSLDYSAWYVNMTQQVMPYTFFVGGQWRGGSITLAATRSGTAKCVAPEEVYNRHKVSNTATYVHAIYPAGCKPNTTPGATITVPVDESFMVFEAQYAGDLKSLQTELMARTFRAGIAKGWLPDKSCAVFMMIDSVEEIPIMECKLWEEGFMTCRASKDSYKFVMSNVNFVFKGFVPRTQKLKTDKALSQGRMAVIEKHHRMISSQKQNPIDQV